MVNRNWSLTIGLSRGLETGDKHGGQLVRFPNEWLKLLGVEIAAINGQSKPEVTFIGFLECDLKFGNKFRFRSATTSGAVICRYTGRASGELIGYCACSRTHRHAIRDAKTFQRELAGTRQKLAHRLSLAGVRVLLNRSIQHGSTF